MDYPASEMSRAVRSLETVRNSKKLLPSFYTRDGARGGKVAWCMQGVPTELLEVFDLVPEWPENFGALCAARSVAPKFIAEAEAEGYTSELCSYATNALGYCKRYCDTGGEPPESPPQGGMLRADVLLGSGYLCDHRYKWFQATGTRYFDVPLFNSDPMSPPIDRDIDDPRLADHHMRYLRADLASQVEFLEKHTGKRFDTDRFRRIMSLSQKSIECWRRVYELRKAKPCPMGAEDYFSCVIPQMFMLGKVEALVFFERLHEEVKTRVDKGIGVLDNERYRLAFYGLPPWHNLGFFNYLERQGAVVVLEGAYYIGPAVEVDLHDPLEGLARRIWRNTCWHHRASAEAMPEICNPGLQQGIGSRLLLNLVKEYGVDGVIFHRTRSCRPWSWGQIHYRNLLEKAGIPTMIFESDMADARAWSDSKVTAQVEPFIETLDQIRYGNR